MRGLKVKDLALVSKIVSKMNVKNQLNDMFVDITDASDEELAKIEDALGTQMLLLLAENYWKAENEVYILLANISGKSKKDIEDLTIGEFSKMLTLIAKDPSFLSFFNLVSG